MWLKMLFYSASLKNYLQLMLSQKDEDLTQELKICKISFKMDFKATSSWMCR